MTICTELEILSVGKPCHFLLAALSGAMEFAGPDGKAEAHGTKGMVMRNLPDTRLVTSDASARLVVWMDAARLERMVQARLGEPPRERLAFAPGFDWNSGQGRVVWRMFMRLLEELHDPDGLMSEPVARETFTDLFLQTVLTRLHHNHTARLERPSGTAIPASSATGRGVHARLRRSADHHEPMSPPPPAAAR